NMGNLKLIWGVPGSGKTEAMKWDMIEGLRQGISSIVFDYEYGAPFADNFSKELPEEVVEVIDFNCIEQVTGMLTLVHSINEVTKWTEIVSQTPDNKRERVLFERFKDLKELTVNYMSVISSLLPESFNQSTYEAWKELDLVLKVVFNNPEKTWVDLYQFLTNENNKREQLLDEFLNATEGFLFVKDEALELKEKQGVLCPELAKMLKEIFSNKKMEKMCQGKPAKEVISQFETPKILIFKIPKVKFTLEQRAFITSILMHQFIYERKIALVEGGPCRIYIDEITVSLPFTMKGILSALVKMSSILKNQVVVAGHGIEILQAYFDDVKGCRPHYLYCGDSSYGVLDYFKAIGVGEEFFNYVHHANRFSKFSLKHGDQGYESEWITDSVVFNKDALIKKLLKLSA
ncbi:MAG: hypothetical protein IJ085_06315, partial [Turicibacter sp.]|nr:hypothetical protein [Turicibacter sp.]